MPGPAGGREGVHSPQEKALRRTPCSEIASGRMICTSMTRQALCRRGHPLSGDNVHVYVTKAGFEAHICRACDRRRYVPTGRQRGPKPLTESDFWARVVKGQGGDACWMYWPARSKGPEDYGSFKGEPAHRYAWSLVHGPIPARVFILHHCDTPGCVRIDHLFAGDNAANMADMAAKGRAGMPKAKLTPGQVAEIRRRVAAGETQRVLAQEFGVSRPHVSKLVAGKVWQRVSAQ